VLGVPHHSLPWSDLHPSWSPSPRIAQRDRQWWKSEDGRGQQILSTSFARVVNHAAEDELEEDVLQHVMATALEE
jgi:hypothetical protein